MLNTSKIQFVALRDKERKNLVVVTVGVVRLSMTFDLTLEEAKLLGQNLLRESSETALAAPPVAPPPVAPLKKLSPEEIYIGLTQGDRTTIFHFDARLMSSPSNKLSPEYRARASITDRLCGTLSTHSYWSVSPETAALQVLKTLESMGGASADEVAALRLELQKHDIIST